VKASTMIKLLLYKGVLFSGGDYSRGGELRAGSSTLEPQGKELS
jgi:hypothetical protein